MRSKCSDNIYYRSKDLAEEMYDLRERINVFFSKRKDHQKDIEKEKENNQSDDIEKIKDKVQECDPLIGFMQLDSKLVETVEQDINRNKNNPDQ